MDTITNKTFDEERALYGAKELLVKNCKFDGPADGESALKECRDITVDILGSRLHGIKALRECQKVNMSECDIISPEFGWSVHGLDMENCTAESEYFMMRSTNLNFLDVRMCV